MGMMVNKESYQELLREDLNWLLGNTERSLERDHIVAILEDSERWYYGKALDLEKMHEESEKYVDQLYEELGDEISCSQSTEDFEAGYKKGWATR